MAFAVEDFADLLRLLDEHPEWREDLRRRVLDDEFLRLPEYVRQNSRDIAQNSVAIAQNSRDIAQNGRDIAQNSADIRQLKEVVAQNSVDILQNGADIRALRETIEESRIEIAARFATLDAQNALFLRDMNVVKGDLGALKGYVAEARWKDGFAGRFGKMVRRARLVTPRDLDAFEEAFDSGRIDEFEADSVRLLDLMIEGVRGFGAEREDVLLAVEISTTIEEYDIARALERAAVLKKVGYNAIPVVAGATMDAQLRDSAVGRGVEVVFSN